MNRLDVMLLSLVITFTLIQLQCILFIGAFQSWLESKIKSCMTWAYCSTATPPATNDVEDNGANHVLI